MNKKIMFVMNQMTSGGAERVVSILANKMSQQMDKISLVITFESEIHYSLNSEIDVIKFNINTNSSQISRNLLEIKKLINTFKENKPDIIISFIRNVNCIIAARIVGIPVIISERNNPKYDPKSKFWRITRKIVYPYADGVVFQTEGARSYFNNSIKRKSCIIQNPIIDSIPIREHKENYNKEIVTIGRLCNQKDQITLIKAFNKFVKEHNDYKLIIYGEGDLRNKLEEEIKLLGIEEYVDMPGNYKDIHDKIKNAQVFVLSSIYEGYPNALIEAMAIGLPVISTSCEYGPSEIISNYNNGILVPVGDYNELEKEISKLVSDGNIMKKLSENAVKIREDLNVDIIVDKWMEYIIKVIDQKKSTI